MSRYISKLLMMLFVALLAANGAELSSNEPTDSETAVNLALAVPIKLKKKQYDADGNFLGCWNTGGDCIVIPFVYSELTLSTEGLDIQ